MFVLVSSFLLLIKSSCQYRLCLFRSEMISQTLQKHKGQSSSCRTEQGILLLFCHVSCVYALLYSIGDAQSQATQYSVHSSCRRWFLNYELKKILMAAGDDAIFSLFLLSFVRTLSLGNTNNINLAA